MIKITPMEEFYLKEICKGKTPEKIAQENNIKINSLSIMFNRLQKKTKLDKLNIILKFLRKEYNVVYRGKTLKLFGENIENTKRIQQLKKLGYTNREIIRELQERI